MLDLKDARFGRLVAVREMERNGYHRMWLCVCDCGGEKIVAMNALRMGRTKSCGCLSDEEKRSRTTLHGLYGSPTHSTWKNMIARCHNPANTGFKNYGVKGVSVCDEWRDSFLTFIADMGPRPLGMTLDRIDNLLGYCPDNCRWAMSREQRMNQLRGTITLEQAAEVRRLHEAHGWGQNTIAKRLGISPGAVSGVLYLNNLAP